MGLDLALGCLVLLGAIRGWLKGFLIQATQLAGLVACVYAAVPLRDLARPEAAKYLPSLSPGLIDRLLWWSSAVVSYLVMVGLATLVIRLRRRRMFDEEESARSDQFGGFLLGTAKGAVVAAFVVAGLDTKYVLGSIQGVGWAEEQARTSQALKWNREYHPAERIWALPPVQQYVSHVRRMGLGGATGDPSGPESGVEAPPEPEPVQTASRAPQLAVPPAEASPSGLERALDELEAKVRALESLDSR